jgi:hypothetical protein
MAKLFAPTRRLPMPGATSSTGMCVSLQRSLIGAGLVLLMCGVATAQTPDPRVDALTKETAQLKRTIADQEGRIADLEKAVKALQASAAPLPARIPAVTPAWYQATNWTLIKSGMSESQVAGILGPPTSVQTTIDTRTLYYSPDSRSTTTLNGTVTLIDDRVTEMTPPAF